MSAVTGWPLRVNEMVRAVVMSTSPFQHGVVATTVPRTRPVPSPLEGEGWGGGEASRKDRCARPSFVLQRLAGLGADRAIHGLRIERQLHQPHADRVVDCIGDR